MSAFSGQPEDVIKKVLSVHVILDYYDLEKFQDLTSPVTLTTLYQQSGKAQNQQGFVFVTRIGRGPVSFGSASPGSSLDATLVKSISTQPYNISVVQISNFINVASNSASPSPPASNSTAPTSPASNSTAPTSPQPTTNAFNITEILKPYPDFTTFNTYLTQTGVAGEINNKETITVLVVGNDNMTAISGQPEDVIKKVLSVHVILDYYDLAKFQDLTSTVTLTTLYQESGKAQNQQGFVNVTRIARGPISFGSASPGSSLDSTLLKQISTQPYKISVVQISNLINIASNSTSPSSPAPSSTAPSSPASNSTTSSSPAASSPTVSANTPPHDPPAASPPRKMLAPSPSISASPASFPSNAPVAAGTADASANGPAKGGSGVSATSQNYNHASAMLMMFITSACFLLISMI